MAAEQFIHPIIEAFVAGRQHALEKARLAQQGQQFTESQKQQKQLEEERLQREQEYRDAQLEQANKTFELTKALSAYQHQRDTLQALQSVQQSGGNPGTVQQFLNNPEELLKNIGSAYSHLPGTGQPQPASGSAPGTAPLPQQTQDPAQQLQSMIPQQQNPQSQVDLSGALGPTIAERQAAQIKQAGDIAEAQEKARRKSESERLAQEAENQKSLEHQKIDYQKQAAEAENTFKAGESAKERQNRIDVAKLDRGTQYSIAQLHETGENHRALYNFGIGLPPEEGASKGALNNLQDQLATGEIDYDPKNRMQFIAQSANDQHGIQPFGKKNRDELANLNQLNDLFDQMTDVVKQGAKTQPGAVFDKALASVWPTELKNKFNTIDTQIQNVAKDLEGVSGGRLLSGIFSAEKGGYPTLDVPISQNLERIEALKRNVVNKEQNRILLGVPDTQKVMLEAKGVPVWPRTIEKNGKTGKLNKEDSLKAGHPIYDIQ